MIEYPVKLKFFSDSGKEIKNGGSASSTASGGARGETRSQKETSKNTKKSTNLLGRIGGTLGGILSIAAILLTVLRPILDVINALTAVLTTIVIKPLEGIIESIGEALQLVQEFLNGEINFQEYVDKAGQWMVDSFMRLPVVESFMALWELLKSGWNVLVEAGKWIWENILKPSWEFLSDVGQWIWEEILKPAWDFLANVGQWIWEQILKPAWDWFTGIGEKIWKSILKPAWDWFKDIGSMIWGILKSAFTNAVSFISRAIKSVLNKIPGVNLGGRAFGGVIPQDGMYMMHAGETVGRGNSVNTATTTNNMSPVININVSGGVDRKTINEISRQMRQQLQSVSRL